MPSSQHPISWYWVQNPLIQGLPPTPSKILQHKAKIPTDFQCGLSTQQTTFMAILYSNPSVCWQAGSFLHCLSVKATSPNLRCQGDYRWCSEHQAGSRPGKTFCLLVKSIDRCSGGLYCHDNVFRSAVLCNACRLCENSLLTGLLHELSVPIRDNGAN